MQSDEGVRKLRQNLSRKMEPGSRRRDCARSVCKDRLVARRIFRIGDAAQIRRERNFPDPVRIDRALETHDTLASFQDFCDTSGSSVERHRRAESHLAPRPNETFPSLATDLLEEKKLDRVVVGKTPGRQ